MIAPVEWLGASVRFLDQTRLPLDVVYRETADHRDLCEAIRTLRVRGAPLIGIAAAYGVALAAAALTRPEGFREALHRAAGDFAATRPTAVNLFWALARVRRVIDAAPDAEGARTALADEAVAIHRDDAEKCRCIGMHGAALVPDGASIVTHCNTGALATGGIGTAFGVLASAHGSGKKIHVYVDETRPLLQGSRLTMWELGMAGIPATLMTDGTAAFLMQRKPVALAVTGADRIAANGDAANKIGTYQLAVAARHHGVPFYVAAPTSTIDPSIPSGAAIPIEERSGEEVASFAGLRTAPAGISVYAPAFDVTPASLITGIITEEGVFGFPYNFTRP